MEAKICVCAAAARVGMCPFAAGGDFGFSLTYWCLVLNYTAAYRALL